MKYLILFLLISCNFPSVEVPKFNDCIILSDSFFCVDERIDEYYVDSLISEVNNNDNISAANKEEMIKYFNANRAVIIKDKEFEIPFKYIAFFRGHTTISPMDRKELEDFTNDLINKYENLRVRCSKKLPKADRL